MNDQSGKTRSEVAELTARSEAERLTIEQLQARLQQLRQQVDELQARIEAQIAAESKSKR